MVARLIVNNFWTCRQTCTILVSFKRKLNALYKCVKIKISWRVSMWLILEGKVTYTLKNWATYNNKQTTETKQTEDMWMLTMAMSANLISLFQLGKFFHLLLLQACGNFSDLIRQQLDDLGQQTEHCLWDDLKTHNRQMSHLWYQKCNFWYLNRHFPNKEKKGKCSVTHN